MKLTELQLHVKFHDLINDLNEREAIKFYNDISEMPEGVCLYEEICSSFDVSDFVDYFIAGQEGRIASDIGVITKIKVNDLIESTLGEIEDYEATCEDWEKEESRAFEMTEAKGFNAEHVA